MNHSHNLQKLIPHLKRNDMKDLSILCPLINDLRITRGEAPLTLAVARDIMFKNISVSYK